MTRKYGESGKPAPATCGNCKFWRHRGEHEVKPTQMVEHRALVVGCCVVDPPGVLIAPTVHGPLHTYPLTAQDYPACGRAEAR